MNRLELLWGEAFFAGSIAQLLARLSGLPAVVLLLGVGLLIGPPIVGAAMDALPPHGFFWSLSAIFIGYAALVASRLALGRSG